MNAVVHCFPDARVKYTFINRGKDEFPDGFAEQLRKEVKLMENLSLQPDERVFLETRCKYLPKTFLDLLQGYRYDSSEVGIVQNGSSLEIHVEGPWYRTILWEVPLMALVSELYFSLKTSINTRPIRINNNSKKVNAFVMNGYKVADFGTRRRYSFDIQEEVVHDFKINGGKSFVGSSNVYLAFKYGVTPIGTHAHEWFMFHAAKYGYKQANRLALDHWVDVYRGDLGIALTDTFTTQSFFKSFDTKLAKLFDGVRHDSGDPYRFVDMTVDHYSKLGIDPLSKTIVFSNGLDVESAIKIGDYCRGKIKCSFGIGTHLTNDVGQKPLNIVIKMSEAKLNDIDEWSKCVKLSDDEGKHTGDPKEIEYCKYALVVK